MLAGITEAPSIQLAGPSISAPRGLIGALASLDRLGSTLRPATRTVRELFPDEERRL